MNKKIVFVSTIIWFFLIGSIFGCLWETILCILQHGVYESRSGLIYGPFTPIYGIGAILFLIPAYYIKSKWRIFIFCSFAGGVFEWLCSFIQEYVFHSLSWDYSNYFLNFGGRTSLFHMIIWGILGTIFCVFIYPFCKKYLDKINKKLFCKLAIVICLFLLFDIMISACAVKRQGEREKGINSKNQIDCFLDKHYPDTFMKKIYPNKTSPEQKRESIRKKEKTLGL